MEIIKYTLLFCEFIIFQSSVIYNNFGFPSKASIPIHSLGGRKYWGLTGSRIPKVAGSRTFEKQLAALYKTLTFKRVELSNELSDQVGVWAPTLREERNGIFVPIVGLPPATKPQIDPRVLNGMISHLFLCAEMWEKKTSNMTFFFFFFKCISL